jgi:hypothetical protein
MDFDVKQINIVVGRLFQVVYLFHQDDNLDATQEFVRYLPKNKYEQRMNNII